MDNKKNNKYKKIYLICLLIILITLSAIIYYKESNSLIYRLEHVNGNPLEFNYESGFYNNTLNIEIRKDTKLPIGTKIYYTLNGDEPTKDSTEYQNSIELQLCENVKVYPLKVIAFYEGEYSKIEEKCYIIGKNIDEEFQIPVISLSIDNKSLNDYYTGIFAWGYYYDITAQNNKDLQIGNFSQRGDDWIRKARISMFDTDGTIVLEQNIGLSITGNSSSAYEVKSLKLTAGKKYDQDHDRINLEDFNNRNNKSNSFLDEYKQIKLRSGSQDFLYGSNIRSSVVSRLAEESGYDGCTTTQRIIVFLNGEFYGVFDMQEFYSSSYLSNKYNLYDDSKIENIKGSESEVLTNAHIKDLFENDLNVKENRDKLESVIDIDNYLFYLAFEILINNNDWPQNNFEMWRYTGEKTPENKYSDGKYRFLIYDCDITFYNGWKCPYPGGELDTFVSLMDGRYVANKSVFKNIINCSYYRDKLITNMLDLLNTSFSESNLEKIINGEYYNIYGTNSKYLSAEKMESMYINYYNMLLSAKRKKNEINQDMEKYFGMKDKYELEISLGDGIQCSLGAIDLYANDTYINKYYKDMNIYLSNKVYPGYKFEYWIVNGNKIYESILNINSDLIRDNKIKIQVVTSKNDK